MLKFHLISNNEFLNIKFFRYMLWKWRDRFKKKIFECESL